MNAQQRALARRRLDERLAEFPRSLLGAPPKGWLVAVREALGMSVREMADRMGVSGQRVSRLEHDELNGRIQISTLEKAAAALNCRVVYVLLPLDGSLDETVQRQAHRKATAIVRDVSGTMELEEQTVSERLQNEQVEELADELKRKRGLWARM